MKRITNKQLEQLVTIINNRLPGGDYSISYMGGVRLVSHNESTDVSPRLTAGQLYLWLHAFIDGIDAQVESAREESKS